MFKEPTNKYLVAKVLKSQTHGALNMNKIGHLLSKLHQNPGVELNFRGLTNNSITKFDRKFRVRIRQ